METENYVAKLNEYSQRTRLALRYEDVGAIGPDHIKTFTVRAVLNDKVYPDGVGKNKKEAKQQAAKNALRGLLEEPAECTENAAEASSAPVLPQTGTININYICWLNEYGQKNKLIIRPVESSRLGPNYSSLCCRFVVGDKEYPAGYGKTKKEAKEEAAKLVYHEICGGKTTEPREDSGISSQQKEESSQNVSEICEKVQNVNIKPEDGSFTEMNFIGLVNHYCQKTRRTHTFIEVRSCGPPHNRQFFYKLVIDNKEYPEGEGKTVKEAKQSAAQLAWSALQEQSDWDSKVSFRSTVSEDSGPTMLSSPTSTLESFKASPQSMERSTTESALLTDSSNPTEAQVSLRSVSVDSVPTQLSTPSSLESLEASSQSMPTGTSDSVVFTDSSNPSKEKDADTNKNMENRPTETRNQSRFTSDFDSIECLAKGGFGRVYKARDKLMDKFYAVKTVRSKEKALREVTALSDLQHPNIVRYYNCWMEDSEYKQDSSEDPYSTTEDSYTATEDSYSATEDSYSTTEDSNSATADSSRTTTDNYSATADSCSSSQLSSNSSPQYLYIKMELCDPRTLEDWIDETNRITLQHSKRREQGLTTALQIVSGVEYIHSKKLIHRDLKPPNIMFGRDGKVKIGDFGLVAAQAHDADGNLMKRTYNKGTESYMAPEQISERNYGEKVDIFALGLIYFELLWKRSTIHEKFTIWDDIRSQTFPEDFSVTFFQESLVIKSMLSEKPEDRPEASKLKAELEKWAQALMHQKNVTVFDGGNVYLPPRKHREEEVVFDYRTPCKSEGTLNLCETAAVSRVGMERKNHVAKLKEFARRSGSELKFMDADPEEPEQTRRFILRAVVNGQDFPIGVGDSREAAKQNAAKSALRRLSGKENQRQEKGNIAENPPAPVYQKSRIKLTYGNCHKKNVPIKSEEATKNPALLVVGDKENTAIHRKTEQEANEEDAKLVYDEISASTEGPLCSAACDDGALANLSTSQTKPELCGTKSKEQNLDVRPKTRAAAYFQNARQKSKKDALTPEETKTKNGENTPSENSGKNFASEFDSIKKLGRGAFGCVFKATQKLLGKDYAIKIVPYKEKALREAKALSDLHHRNIVRYYSCWKEDSEYQWDNTDDSCSTSRSSTDSSVKYLYIQMELCKTETLKDWINEKNTRSSSNSKRGKESLTIALQIVSGVEYIHSKMLIHRDLKPANIMFGLDGDVKIGDFGLVTAENDDDAQMERTVYKGTPSYMAPEQKSETTYDRKVDIYSSALIYFELLWKTNTGHERATVWRDARRQKLPREFSHSFPTEYMIIRTMLSVKPEDRPEASQLTTDLEQYAARLNTQAIERRGSRTV
ncbi:uncharacterized protein LOC108885817 [Lates calcarifer]|uniref:non-specific serine/threonine protein kinase n=1 Tax=Lates calcarifer TaxID=8187 RepID=A0AAJ8BGG3_LATCA|nr:uncharacterized protein LOC108885817 [Lates calcarifer]